MNIQSIVAWKLHLTWHSNSQMSLHVAVSIGLFYHTYVKRKKIIAMKMSNCHMVLKISIRSKLHATIITLIILYSKWKMALMIWLVYLRKIQYIFCKIPPYKACINTYKLRKHQKTAKFKHFKISFFDRQLPAQLYTSDWRTMHFSARLIYGYHL